MAVRKRRNMTQANVAEKANIARTTYAMIETGERNTSVDIAKKIAQVLNFDWTIFFEQ
ncbi:helix-turn-helix transcriptional regulator [Sporolactobacillus pectinivorans]|uniref:helix-turn-helix transcriptional regulator n=1 Tax=Sporolactobacillus pectinivorans TaxID=1591408 RepID=UPI0023D7CBC7|nr:helix-turn-helix transcriptional regulator [Sporolactobacillus pectinivorans]